MPKPKKSVEGSVGEVTPQHKHVKKLLDQEAKRKAQPIEVVERTVKEVMSGGAAPRRKYQEITRLSNGNKFSRPISKEQYEERRGS